MALRFTTSKSGAAYAYLAVAGGLTASHLLLPRPVRGFTMPLVQLSAAVVIVVAVRRSRPLAAAWWALAAGLGMWAVGSVIWAAYWVVWGRGVPFPGAGDLFFTSGYALMGGARPGGLDRNGGARLDDGAGSRRFGGPAGRPRRGQRPSRTRTGHPKRRFPSRDGIGQWVRNGRQPPAVPRRHRRRRAAECPAEAGRGEQGGPSQ